MSRPLVFSFGKSADRHVAASTMRARPVTCQHTDMLGNWHFCLTYSSNQSSAGRLAPQRQPASRSPWHEFTIPQEPLSALPCPYSCLVRSAGHAARRAGKAVAGDPASFCRCLAPWRNRLRQPCPDGSKAFLWLSINALGPFFYPVCCWGRRLWHGDANSRAPLGRLCRSPGNPNPPRRSLQRRHQPRNFHGPCLSSSSDLTNP